MNESYDWFNKAVSKLQRIHSEFPHIRLCNALVSAIDMGDETSTREDILNSSDDYVANKLGAYLEDLRHENQQDREKYTPPEDLVAMCAGIDKKLTAFLSKHDPEGNQAGAMEAGMVFFMGLDVYSFFHAAGIEVRSSPQAEEAALVALKNAVLDLGDSDNPDDLREVASEFVSAIVVHYGLLEAYLAFPSHSDYSIEYNVGQMLFQGIPHWRDHMEDYQIQEVNTYASQEVSAWVHPDRQGYFILPGFENV